MGWAFLFVFHRHVRVCRNRVALLRSLNPGVPVFGIWGGREGIFRTAGSRALAGLFSLDDVYCLTGRDTYWKWKNVDLSVAAWYRDVGSANGFDALHVCQWDALPLQGLQDLHAGLPAGAVGLSGLVPLSEVYGRWSWTSREPMRTDSLRLYEIARERWGYDDQPFASVGPGAVLPRAFLERFAAEDIPEAGHDEIRLPLFAQIFGHELLDTGFMRSWFDPVEAAVFNVDGIHVSRETVLRQLDDPRGRRYFHPYRQTLPLRHVREVEAGGLAEPAVVPVAGEAGR